MAVAMDGATTSGGGGGGAFTGSTLADKLSKLNASQQSIETLSHWCIFHRKKAKEVVETWGRKFHEAPREQRVPFLYLANDILQNSRRKGLEFVNEFWTVLPPLLKEVVGTGDEAIRNAALRLVDIWEERKVFGSNVRNLREEMLGKGTHPPVQDVKTSALPPYYFFEGGMLERIARSYQAVQENVAEEDAALANCNAAITRVESLQKKAENSTGELQESITEELLAQQVSMAQCIEQLEACEMGHAMLVSNLRDALLEQESKLEQLRTHLQIAQAQLEQAGSVQHHLMTGSPSLADAIGTPSEGNSLLRNESLYHHHEKQQPVKSKDNGNQVVMSSQSTGISTVAETNSQAEHADNSSIQASAATMAAEVAAKLAASSSSAAMLTSVLSSLAAEEASGGPHSPSYDVGGGQPTEKRPRLDGRLDSLQTPDNSYAQHQMLPPMSQYMGGPVMPLPYAYQSSLPPPPPIQSHMMTGHRIPVPPRPVPPAYGPPPYKPFPPSRTQFYNQPPLPAPPAPAPRQ